MDFDGLKSMTESLDMKTRAELIGKHAEYISLANKCGDIGFPAAAVTYRFMSFIAECAQSGNVLSYASSSISFGPTCDGAAYAALEVAESNGMFMGMAVALASGEKSLTIKRIEQVFSWWVYALGTTPGASHDKVLEILSTDVDGLFARSIKTESEKIFKGLSKGLEEIEPGMKGEKAFLLSESLFAYMRVAARNGVKLFKGLDSFAPVALDPDSLSRIVEDSIDGKYSLTRIFAFISGALVVYVNTLCLSPDVVLDAISSPTEIIKKWLEQSQDYRFDMMSAMKSVKDRDDTVAKKEETPKPESKPVSTGDNIEDLLNMYPNIIKGLNKLKKGDSDERS